MEQTYRKRSKTQKPKKIDSFTARFTACAIILCVFAGMKYTGTGEKHLQKLSYIISKNDDFSFIKEKLKKKTFSLPVTGTVTNVFSDKHKGVDIGAEKGTPVFSAKEGYVAEAGENGDYGNCVQVIHPDGLLTLYAHLDSISVKKGDNVTTQTELGKVGSTGDSTGPHLHFEIQKNGEYLNPGKETNGL